VEFIVDDGDIVHDGDIADGQHDNSDDDGMEAPGHIADVNAETRSDIGGPATTTTTATVAPTPPPSGDGAAAAGHATTYVTMGVAPGDGDLMPPRFSGDRKTDAEEWLQDLLDYIEIRKVPKTTATVLLRTRLTGVARKWLESVPPATGFDETVRRFRKRFGDNEGTRNELLNEFWHRRQGPTEPTGTYIEEMASLARRMKLDSEPLMRQGIIQGLRPEIQRDVKLQKPTTLEALAEAAAIGEANAKAAAARNQTDDAAVSSQLAEMRAMMSIMQDMMAANPRPTIGVHAVDAPTSRTEQPGSSRSDPASSTTATTTAAQEQPGTATTSTALPTAISTDGPRSMTIQVVMPNASEQYGDRRDGPGGRPGRGRGRGWRGPWRGRPAAYQPQHHQLDPTATTFQPNTGGPWTTSNNTTTCNRCARRHAEGACLAAHAVCFQCGIRGHFARCCRHRQNPTELP